jgi:2-oxoglutarate ferredoxin oxidoreductase subunit delta
MTTAQTSEKTKKVPKSWGTVRVFGRWCKGCGLCIAFCPADVFEADDDGHPNVRYPDRCTGCEWCEFHCPDMAIKVSRHTRTAAERSQT